MANNNNKQNKYSRFVNIRIRMANGKLIYNYHFFPLLMMSSFVCWTVDWKWNHKIIFMLQTSSVRSLSLQWIGWIATAASVCVRALWWDKSLSPHYCVLDSNDTHTAAQHILVSRQFQFQLAHSAHFGCLFIFRLIAFCKRILRLAHRNILSSGIFPVRTYIHEMPLALSVSI